MKTSNIRKLIVLVGALILAVALTANADPIPPKAGDLAPLVTGKDQKGHTWKLAKLVGKKNVLLYFYPKDETPGCTAEACSLRDYLDDFKKDNVQVVGVSFDDAESHQAFIKNHQLNFPLIADTDGKIADAYGARKAGKDMDRRVSFLIGKDGKIIHVTDSPNPIIHLQEMKEAIAQLPK